MLETDNADLLELCHTFETELSLRQGDMDMTVRWARKHVPKPFTPAYRFYSPQLALPKVLVFQAADETLSEVERLLSEMETYYEKIYNHSILIHIRALWAVLANLKGEAHTAQRKLTASLRLARPGRQLRPFLDLGVEMQSLLKQQARIAPGDRFTAAILKAFDSERSGGNRLKIDRTAAVSFSPDRRITADPLTTREIEVLKFLAEGLTNNEIASQLYISPLTVKRHLANIYRKLSVKSRQQAIISAKSIGIG